MEKGVSSSSRWKPPVSSTPEGHCMQEGGSGGSSSKGDAAVEVEADIPVPHRGLIILDHPYDQEDTFIVHRLSYERARLPSGGGWFLEFDGKGMGCAADAADKCECLLVEDLLQRVVVRRGGKQLWVVDRAAQKEWCISDKMQRFKRLEVSVLLCPSWQPQALPAVLLDMPRAACRFFWEASSFYTIMGLDCYQGQASNWVYRQSKAWTTHIRSLGLGDGHILKGMHGNAKGMDSASDDEEDLFMPFPGFSTCAVLALGAKWASSPGSLTQQANSRFMAPQAARFLFQSLLAGSVRHSFLQGFSVDIRFRKEWASE